MLRDMNIMLFGCVGRWGFVLVYLFADIGSKNKYGKLPPKVLHSPCFHQCSFTK